MKVALGEVCTVRSSVVDPRLPAHRDLLHVAPDSIERNTGHLGPIRTAAEDGVISGKYRFESGDILYSKIRPNLNKVVKATFSGLCSADMYAISADDGRLDSGFLVHLLRSDMFLAYAVALSNRANIPKLNRNQLLGFTFELPSVPEQRRISTILDHGESLRAARWSQIGLLDELCRELFRDLSRESTSQGFRLGDIAEFVRGVTFKPADKVSAGAGAVAVMRTKNVQSVLDRSDEIHIPSELVRRPDQYLRVGDTLISSANSWNLVGKACLVQELKQPAAIGGFVTALRATEKIDPVYLYYWFSSPEIQTIARSFSSQTTSIANLNLRRCLELRVELPRPDLQRKFSRQVAAIQCQRETLENSAAMLGKILDSLNYRAFRSGR